MVVRITVNYYHLIIGAVPWLRWLVAGLSPQIPGFAPGSMPVGFVVEKIYAGTGFSPSSSVFSSQYHSTVLHTHISSEG
jgi:hypothetical protein